MAAVTCMLGCGGAACRHENWVLWLRDDCHPNAFNGLFSNWITANILAMQRPSSRLIADFDLVNVFRDAGITAIFNLQLRGEHALCGDGLEAESGFAYLPEVWMNAGVSHFNFGWIDMTVPDLSLIMRIVQVMAHEIDSGGKIAVHCHAGLGRTGLAIASFLIYHQKMMPEEAIRAVRSKRPKSIQRKVQHRFIASFKDHLDCIKVVFPNVVPQSMAAACRFTFHEQIDNKELYQRGTERRILKNVPKLVLRCVERLRHLCSSNNADDASESEEPEPSADNHDISEWLKTHPRNASLLSAKSVAQRITQFQFKEPLDRECSLAMVRVNDDNYTDIDNADSCVILVNLIMHWLCLLKHPLLSEDILDLMSECDSDVLTAVEKSHKAVFATLNVLVEIFRMVPENTQRNDAIYRFALILTSHRNRPFTHHQDPQKSPVLQPAPLKEEHLSPAATDDRLTPQRLTNLRKMTPSPWSDLEDDGGIAAGEAEADLSVVWDVFRFLVLMIDEFRVEDRTHPVRK